MRLLYGTQALSVAVQYRRSWQYCGEASAFLQYDGNGLYIYSHDAEPDPTDITHGVQAQPTFWNRYQQKSCDELLPIQIERACAISAVDGVCGPQKSNTVVLYTEKQIQA